MNRYALLPLILNNKILPLQFSTEVIMHKWKQLTINVEKNWMKQLKTIEQLKTINVDENRSKNLLGSSLINLQSVPFMWNKYNTCNANYMQYLFCLTTY